MLSLALLWTNGGKANAGTLKTGDNPSRRWMPCVEKPSGTTKSCGNNNVMPLDVVVKAPKSLLP
jgi:hypothetical protein